MSAKPVMTGAPLGERSLVRVRLGSHLCVRRERNRRFGELAERE